MRAMRRAWLVCNLQGDTHGCRLWWNGLMCASRELGFFGCLGKPFSAAGLLRFIEAIQRNDFQWLSVTTS